MRPGRKPKKGQLGLFEKPDKTSKTFKKTKPVRRRLSPETLACRKLARKLCTRGLICATLKNRVTGKTINVINIVGAEIEILAGTSGFDEKKFIKELFKDRVYDPNAITQVIAKCWPYKKSGEDIKKVQKAIDVITMLISDSANAKSQQRRYANVTGTQLDRQFKRKIKGD